jgi:hypothetical protein
VRGRHRDTGRSASHAGSQKQGGPSRNNDATPNRQWPPFWLRRERRAAGHPTGQAATSVHSWAAESPPSVGHGSNGRTSERRSGLWKAAVACAWRYSGGPGRPLGCRDAPAGAGHTGSAHPGPGVQQRVRHRSARQSLVEAIIQRAGGHGANALSGRTPCRARGEGRWWGCSERDGPAPLIPHRLRIRKRRSRNCEFRDRLRHQTLGRQ